MGKKDKIVKKCLREQDIDLRYIILCKTKQMAIKIMIQATKSYNFKFKT
jgi:hypothetical protein